MLLYLFSLFILTSKNFNTLRHRPPSRRASAIFRCSLCGLADAHLLLVWFRDWKKLAIAHCTLIIGTNMIGALPEFFVYRLIDIFFLTIKNNLNIAGRILTTSLREWRSYSVRLWIISWIETTHLRLSNCFLRHSLLLSLSWQSLIITSLHEAPRRLLLQCLRQFRLTYF